MPPKPQASGLKLNTVNSCGANVVFAWDGLSKPLLKHA
jgi:hypothetical protein